MCEGRGGGGGPPLGGGALFSFSFEIKNWSGGGGLGGSNEGRGGAGGVKPPCCLRFRGGGGGGRGGGGSHLLVRDASFSLSFELKSWSDERRLEVSNERREGPRGMKPPRS